MAPAVQPGSKPWAVPIPMRATPIVAIVVHELPVMTDIRALIAHAAARNTDGKMTFMP